MLKRIIFPAIAGLTAFSLNGCMVAESTYLKKVEETDNLAREFGNLKLEYEKRSAENSALKAEVAVQLKNKQELELLLKAKSDMLSQNVGDLRQQVTVLETENRELLKARKENVKEAGNIYEKLLLDMKNEVSQGQATISELKGKLTINLDAALLFDSGKSDIQPTGLTVLQKLAATLREIKDRVIRIEGHTDSIAITSAQLHSLPANWELSAARAINIVTYLRHQGIDPAVLSAVIFSEYRPGAVNGAKERRAGNRHIHITLVAKD